MNNALREQRSPPAVSETSAKKIHDIPCWESTVTPSRHSLTIRLRRPEKHMTIPDDPEPSTATQVVIPCVRYCAYVTVYILRNLGLSQPLMSRLLSTGVKRRSSTLPSFRSKTTGRQKPEPSDVIVGGKGTVKCHDMPLVHREEELWRVFEVNAKACLILQALKCEPTPTQLLSCHMLCCIQYFGGGKTELGLKFGKQVAKGVLDKRAESCIELASELALLKAKGIRNVYCDVASTNDIIYHTLSATYGRHEVAISSSRDAAEQLVAVALKLDQPLFIHYDEVGSKIEHCLIRLRKFVHDVWIEMWRAKHIGHDMPRIFFFVTGRWMDYFEKDGQSSLPRAPTGTELLVLNMFEPKHVGEIRRFLQSRVPSLVLNGVTDDVAAYLDQSLCAVTGGAPRLLLYTLRALHYLCVYEGVSLDSKANIDHAIYERVFDLINDGLNFGREMVSAGLFGEERELRCSEFGLLLSLALFEVPLLFETVLQVPRGPQIEVGQLLMWHPFFLAHHEKHGNDMFVLTLPLYHLRAMAAKLDGTLPQWLAGMAAAAIHLHQPWRIFALLPVNPDAIRASFSSSNWKKATWASVIPEWFGASELAGRMKFSLGTNPFQVIVIDMAAKLRKQILARNSASIPVGKDNAVSSDGDYGTLRDDTKFFSTHQLRAELCQEGLQLGDLVGEFNKIHCPVFVPVVICVITSSLNEGLNSCVLAQTGRVLVLKSWSMTSPAEFALHETGLLWHRNGQEEWYKWPGREKTSEFTGALTEQLTRIVVRRNLEVVIPHPDFVRELVSPNLFDNLLNGKKTEDTSTSSSVICMPDSMLST